MQCVPPGNPRKPRQPELVTSYTSPMPSTALGAGPSSCPPQVSKPTADDLAQSCPSDALRGRSSHRLSIRNMCVTLWSYGDSNPRPLACHPAATRPPACIGAGHRPRTSARVHRNPGLLRYFPAVRPDAPPPEMSTRTPTTNTADRSAESCSGQRPEIPAVTLRLYSSAADSARQVGARSSQPTITIPESPVGGPTDSAEHR